MPKRFSKRKLQVVNTETNRPIHPQPTSSKTYNPYAALVPFTSVFLLELTVNTCRKKESPPTTLVAILNLRARSRGHAWTNQTFFASELSTQRQNECACANSFPPFSRAGASRETGFKRNHSAENGGNSKIPVICFHFAEIRPSRNR